LHWLHVCLNRLKPTVQRYSVGLKRQTPLGALRERRTYAGDSEPNRGACGNERLPTRPGDIFHHMTGNLLPGRIPP